jgi:hypothetical protein
MSKMPDCYVTKKCTRLFKHQAPDYSCENSMHFDNVFSFVANHSRAGILNTHIKLYLTMFYAVIVSYLILIFITVKTELLNYLMTIIRQHVSTLWGSSSGLYKELKTI